MKIKLNELSTKQKLAYVLNYVEDTHNEQDKKDLLKMTSKEINEAFIYLFECGELND
tara:strand:+ start:60 stop:230 length:171 start_codon:yes stop_codon:yes gene_type:complete